MEGQETENKDMEQKNASEGAMTDSMPTEGEQPAQESAPAPSESEKPADGETPAN